MQDLLWVVNQDGTMSKPPEGHWLLSDAFAQAFQEQDWRESFQALGMAHIDNHGIDIGDSDPLEGFSEYKKKDNGYPRLFVGFSVDDIIGFFACDDPPSYIAACGKLLPIAQYWKAEYFLGHIEMRLEEMHKKSTGEVVSTILGELFRRGV